MFGSFMETAFLNLYLSYLFHSIRDWFPATNLISSIPTEFGLLTDLKQLYLCKFTDTIYKHDHVGTCNLVVYEILI